MKVLAITQARIGSSRLPGKTLKLIQGQTLLAIHLKRILRSKLITQLKVATTHEEGVEKIIQVCNECRVGYHQGSLHDVLERFYETAKPYSPDLVVRVTSDCPLIDPDVIDTMIQKAIDNGKDYTSNTIVPTYPDGIDVEVMKFSALEKAYKEAKIESEREHVTPYIWKNSSLKGGQLFSAESIENPVDFSDVRLTVDTSEDLEVIRKVIDLDGLDKSWKVYAATLKNNPQIKTLNDMHQRNEGYTKSINKEV
jgi:spore coat polysaccharide biosynthesis protein SpsF